jgi:hypothetical protein
MAGAVLCRLSWLFCLRSLDGCGKLPEGLGRLGMPATKYKVLAVGPQVANTATAPVYVSIAGVAKKSQPATPYIVVNELISNALARMLVLPCPPGALMHQGAETYFFSLDFNLAGQSLPPISPTFIVKTFPQKAWGIILFDALIMNTDRHRQNIAHDTVTNRIQIFDHSHALLTAAGDIDQTLQNRAGTLAIGGHCLAQEIDTDDGRDFWLQRVKLIPDFFIEEVVAASVDCGLPSDRKDLLASFMKDRRDNLDKIVAASKPLFPKLP